MSLRSAPNFSESVEKCRTGPSKLELPSNMPHACPYLAISSSLRHRTLTWNNDADDSFMTILRSLRSYEPIQNWMPPVLRPTTYEEMLDDEEDSEVADERFESGFGDSPYVTAAFLLFSESAISRIDSILRKSGELLPVRVIGVDMPYYAFHCTTSCDVIDMERSTIERHEHGGALRSVVKAVYRKGVGTYGKLFRINGPNPFQIYCDVDTSNEINDVINGLVFQDSDSTLRVWLLEGCLDH